MNSFKEKIKTKLRNIIGISRLENNLEEMLNKIVFLENSIGERDDEFEIFIKGIHTILAENTNICGYSCVMCPHGSMKRPMGALKNSDLELLLKNIFDNRKEYNRIFSLNNFGEPLMDKKLAEKIALVRKWLPSSFIHIQSTLGYELPSGIFDELIDSGLNIIKISFYGSNRETYKAIHGVDRFDLAMQNMVRLANSAGYRAGKCSVVVIGPTSESLGGWARPSSPEFKNIGSLATAYDEEEYAAVKQKFIDYGFSYHAYYLGNFGGQFSFNTSQIPTKHCSIYKGTLQGALVTTWDLNVLPCCQIWDNQIIFGNLREKSLREIFYDDPWSAFRDAHKRINLKKTYPFCYKCLQDPAIQRA
jgi:MoaA/NifB/PqqE/SkfB family radical SAM enzyme